MRSGKKQKQKASTTDAPTGATLIGSKPSSKLSVDLTRGRGYVEDATSGTWKMVFPIRPITLISQTLAYVSGVGADVGGGVDLREVGLAHRCQGKRIVRHLHFWSFWGRIGLLGENAKKIRQSESSVARSLSWGGSDKVSRWQEESTFFVCTRQTATTTCARGFFWGRNLRDVWEGKSLFGKTFFLFPSRSKCLPPPPPPGAVAFIYWLQNKQTPPRLPLPVTIISCFRNK